MKYFISGATGFIGGRIAHQLIADGHDVIALVRESARGAELAALGATLARGDITDKESMRAAMAGVDGVFHTAGWYVVGAPDRDKARRINVEGTRNVLELMRELGVPRGVYTSTNAVFSNTGGRLVDERYHYDGPHLSLYDQSKWEAHFKVAQPMIDAGLPLIIVQPGIVLGPGDHSAIRTMLVWYLRRTLPLAAKRFGFCVAHVDDVARGHILAMQNGTPGESYSIGGPPITLVELLERCRAISGVPLPLLRVGPPLLKLSAALMAPLSWIAPLPVIFHPETLRVAAGTTYTVSDEKARQTLGFSTRPLEDTLRELLAHELRLLGREPQF